jgi:hypothetical protein
VTGTACLTFSADDIQFGFRLVLDSDATSKPWGSDLSQRKQHNIEIDSQA